MVEDVQLPHGSHGLRVTRLKTEIGTYNLRSLIRAAGFGDMTSYIAIQNCWEAPGSCLIPLVQGDAAL